MIVFQTKNPESNFDFSNAVGFEVFSSLGQDSTTNRPPNFVNKLTGTTTESETGVYVINWYAEMTNSGNNNIVAYRVQFKRTSDTVWIDACNLELLVTRNEAYEILSGFRVFEITSPDTIDFRVQFVSLSATARIRNTNLYIFRVAQ